jgi:hypothetical protein
MGSTLNELGPEAEADPFLTVSCTVLGWSLAFWNTTRVSWLPAQVFEEAL